MQAAAAARAAAHQMLYGPTGRPAVVGAGGAEEQQQQAPVVAEAEMKALVVRLMSGKQADLVRAVMKQHGTLALLDD